MSLTAVFRFLHTVDDRGFPMLQILDISECQKYDVYVEFVPMPASHVCSSFSINRPFFPSLSNSGNRGTRLRSALFVSLDVISPVEQYSLVAVIIRYSRQAIIGPFLSNLPNSAVAGATTNLRQWNRGNRAGS